SARPTSAVIPRTSAPVSLRLALTVAWRGPSLRAQIATLQPSRARASAVARPIPWLAAATRATLPRIPRSTGAAIEPPRKKDSALASFAQEAADLADGLEPERLVHLLRRVEEVRDQQGPFAPSVDRALAGFEEHRATDASHPEIRVGRDVVDPCEDAPRPHTHGPGRRSIQVRHVRLHSHALGSLAPDAPQLFDHVARMAESHIGGGCDRAEVVHRGPCRGRSELQIRVHDAVGESDLRQGEFRGGTESQADELLLEREGLLRVLEQERLVGDRRSAEGLS